MNIDDNMLYAVFNYKVLTNEEKNFIKVDEDLIRYNNIYHSFESRFNNVDMFINKCNEVLNNNG